MSKTRAIANKVVTCRYCGKEHTIIDYGCDSYYEGVAHNKETGDNLMYMGYYEEVYWATPQVAGLPEGLVPIHHEEGELHLKVGDWKWHQPCDSNRHPYWEQLEKEETIPWHVTYARQ